jgi:hypothetical protein
MDGELITVEAKPETRVRMNFGMNSKGLVQMDVTVEMPDTEAAEAEGMKAIDAYKRVCEAKGLRLADSAA